MPLRIEITVENAVVPHRPIPDVSHEMTPGGHLRYYLTEAPLSQQQLMVVISESELRLAGAMAKRWVGPTRGAVGAFARGNYDFSTLVQAEHEIVTAMRTCLSLTDAEYAEVRCIVETLQRVTGFVWTP